MDIELIIRKDVKKEVNSKIRILLKKKAKDILIEGKILRMKKLLVALKENKKENMVKNIMAKKREDIIMEKKEEEEIITRNKEEEDAIMATKVNLTIMKEKDIAIMINMDPIPLLRLNNRPTTILLKILLNSFNQLTQIRLLKPLKSPVIAILKTQAHLRRNSSTAKVSV